MPIHAWVTAGTGTVTCLSKYQANRNDAHGSRHRTEFANTEGHHSIHSKGEHILKQCCSAELSWHNVVVTAHLLHLNTARGTIWRQWFQNSCILWLGRACTGIHAEIGTLLSHPPRHTATTANASCTTARQFCNAGKSENKASRSTSPRYYSCSQ